MNVSEGNDSDVPEPRSGDRPAPAAHQVDFPPVQNGVDYLDSVADQLRSGQPSPRNLKYAVLHLQAAAEVLLKARLVQEHWSLVFKDPGTAKRERFEAGDFDSCTTTGAIGRLRDIAGVAVGDKPAKSLAILAKWRNRLQHYGLTAPAPAVEVTAAQVLDFLVAFVHDELLPALPGPEAAEAAADLESVGTKVRGITSYMAARLKRLADELKDAADRTVMCPVCDQWALVLGNPALVMDCRFCHTTWPNAVLALEEYYEVNLLDANVQDCPECTQHTLVVESVGTVAVPGASSSVCFCCGTNFAVAAQCTDCYNVFIPDPAEDYGLCGNC
ncbi:MULTISPECIES: hypothetical protein [Streptomyces]|uniref:hypothetical protein n=1 Tax=Streptomyces TaxID=1883 RepID=UPI0004CDC4F8|nr:MULTISPECIES: hypothetical protein [Streptomyces]ARE79450.1 hypothetical protein B6R96_36100 [Streptomyces sp. Sge12]